MRCLAPTASLSWFRAVLVGTCSSQLAVTLTSPWLAAMCRSGRLPWLSTSQHLLELALLHCLPLEHCTRSIVGECTRLRGQRMRCASHLADPQVVLGLVVLSAAHWRAKPLQLAHATTWIHEHVQYLPAIPARRDDAHHSRIIYLQLCPCVMCGCVRWRAAGHALEAACLCMAKGWQCPRSLAALEAANLVSRGTCFWVSCVPVSITMRPPGMLHQVNKSRRESALALCTHCDQTVLDRDPGTG